MPVVSQPLRPSENWKILNAIREGATLDYQNRVPKATQANIAETVATLWSYTPDRNQFIDALVNKIGLTIARHNSWTNPLAMYKRGMLSFGDTIEEVALGLAQAYVYDPDRENLERMLFGQHRVESQSSFHKINRQEFYVVTVNETVLARAFTEPMGLSTFITQLMEVPMTSDNADEFNQTTRLFKEYDNNNGYFNVNVPDISSLSSGQDEARMFLRKARAMADTLPFLSTRYNAAGLPVHANRDDLVMFLTPEANASIDVEGLAGLFNVERGQVPFRTTVIPAEKFDMEGTQAILTTPDFFVIADTRFEMLTQPNAASLTTNHFLHHHEILSVSRFVPAVKFSTAPDTPIVVQDSEPVEVPDVTIQDRDGNTVTEIKRGELYQVTGAAITDPEGGLRDAVRLRVIGARSDFTYLTQTGVLQAGVDEESTELTIRATAVDDPTLRSETSVDVVGDRATIWPRNGVDTDSDEDGLYEVTPKEPTVNDNTVTIPTVRGVQYRKDGADVANGSEHTITASTTFTAVARPGSEITSGATTSWTYAPTETS